MDGYIKNKKEAIISVRKSIFAKYMLTAVIVLLLLFWLFMLVVMQPYEDWEQTEIQFSHISQEHITVDEGRSYVLNTQDGRKFVIQLKHKDVAKLKECLIPGEAYSLVFCNTPLGKKQMKALWNEGVVFQNLDDSISRWERERRGLIIAVIATLALEIVAVAFIDRFCCKKEYAKIKKLKEDILRRECRIRDR